MTPSPQEVIEALSLLGMTPDEISCAYCGARTTDWDHLRPLVKSKRPTGFITEIRNLVPACGPCNQSKGGNHWETWMGGEATGSPRTKRVPDLEKRMERLRRFEAWGNVKPLPLDDLADEVLWSKHWDNLETVITAMKSAQDHAEQLRSAIHMALAARTSDKNSEKFRSQNPA